MPEQFGVDRDPLGRLFIHWWNAFEGCEPYETITEAELLATEEGRRAFAAWRAGDQSAIEAAERAGNLAAKQDRSE